LLAPGFEYEQRLERKHNGFSEERTHEREASQVRVSSLGFLLGLSSDEGTPSLGRSLFTPVEFDSGEVIEVKEEDDDDWGPLPWRVDWLCWFAKKL